MASILSDAVASKLFMNGWKRVSSAFFLDENR